MVIGFKSMSMKNIWRELGIYSGGWGGGGNAYCPILGKENQIFSVLLQMAKIGPIDGHGREADFSSNYVFNVRTLWK